MEDLKVIEDVRVDLVFDRGRFIGRDVAIINPPIPTLHKLADYLALQCKEQFERRIDRK